MTSENLVVEPDVVFNDDLGGVDSHSGSKYSFAPLFNYSQQLSSPSSSNHLSSSSFLPKVPLPLGQTGIKVPDGAPILISHTSVSDKIDLSHVADVASSVFESATSSTSGQSSCQPPHQIVTHHPPNTQSDVLSRNVILQIPSLPSCHPLPSTVKPSVTFPISDNFSFCHYNNESSLHVPTQYNVEDFISENMTDGEHDHVLLNGENNDHTTLISTNDDQTLLTLPSMISFSQAKDVVSSYSSPNSPQLHQLPSLSHLKDPSVGSDGNRIRMSSKSGPKLVRSSNDKIKVEILNDPESSGLSRKECLKIGNRLRMRLTRMNETPEEKAMNRMLNLERRRKYLKSESAEERMIRLKKLRETKRTKVANMNEELKKELNRKVKLAKKQSLEYESYERKENRLRYIREKAKSKRENESNEERERRRAEGRERKRNKIRNETPEEKKTRLANDAEKRRLRRKELKKLKIEGEQNVGRQVVPSYVKQTGDVLNGNILVSSIGKSKDICSSTTSTSSEILSSGSSSRIKSVDGSSVGGLVSMQREIVNSLAAESSEIQHSLFFPIVVEDRNDERKKRIGDQRQIQSSENPTHDMHVGTIVPIHISGIGDTSSYSREYLIGSSSVVGSSNGERLQAHAGVHHHPTQMNHMITDVEDDGSNNLSHLNPVQLCEAITTPGGHETPPHSYITLQASDIHSSF